MRFKRAGVEPENPRQGCRQRRDSPLDSTGAAPFQSGAPLARCGPCPSPRVGGRVGCAFTPIVGMARTGADILMPVDRSEDYGPDGARLN